MPIKLLPASMEKAAMLGMHMANELLSPSAAIITLVIGAAAVGWASIRARRGMEAQRLPLMGVLGAFVFAGQMINFTLPGMPGTSGHLGGGVLLAILLGPAAGVVVMSAVLIIQCLLFQDGGLLALGCNIVNMGLVPCLLGGWLYKAILGAAARAAAWRQYIAAWAACILGLTAGAAMVPLEAAIGGRLMIATGDFLAVMVGVHLLIGLVEGLITFVVIAYIRQVRPGVLGLQAGQRPARQGGRIGAKALAASLVGTALLLAGVVSWFASTHPDGLEWAYQEHRYAGQGGAVVKAPSGAVATVDAWQAKWSVLSDYGKRPAPLGQQPPRQDPPLESATGEWGQVDGWRSLAGLTGTLATLGVVLAVSAALRPKRTMPA